MDTAKATKLRMAAEARLKEKMAETFKDMASADLPKLVQELQIHQIELELQNEELLNAQKAAEEARDNFLDLYELAPIAYLTLDNMAIIKTINLTGARVLGLERSKLLQRGFSDFVADHGKSFWKEQLNKVRSQLSGVSTKFELDMMRADGTVFPAHLVCLRRQMQDAMIVIRVAMFDISKSE